MQTVDTERYIELVRVYGIEEAHKMRFRGTGRTVRDVLTLVKYLSAGEYVELHTVNAPGQNRWHCQEVMNKVRETANFLGMQFIHSPAHGTLSCPQSGGVIKLIHAGSCRRGERTINDAIIYELHRS